MELKLVTVGKTDVKWVKEGLDLYVSRLRHYVPFSLVEIPQLKNVSALSQEQIKEKEGELILKHRGGKGLVFVIGGAYGFSKAVYDRAEGMISLSKMTFSHQMVRTVFAEQLYRAFTIIRGEPYHHE